MGGFLLWPLATSVLHHLALRLCPPDLLVSGTCAAPWFPLADQLARCAGAASAAVAMVGLPMLAAPAARRRVAWGALGLGTGLALYVLLAAGVTAVPPFLSALTAGTLAALLAGGRRGPGR